MEAHILQAISVLIKRWKFILPITILLGMLGAVRGMAWPTYEAQTMLVVTSLGASGETAKLLGAPYPAKVYSALLLSPQTVGATIDRLVAEGHFAKDDAPKVDDLTRYLSVYVETIDATTRPVTYSPLIRLTAVSQSEELAIAIVQEWSKVSIEQANSMLTLSLAAASDTLARQTGELEVELNGIWKQLAEESGKYDIELMRKEAELRVQQLDTLETEKLLTTRELDGFRKSLESVTASLANEKPYVELARAPSEEAYWLAEVTGGKRSIEELGGKVMVSQELNVVYWDMKKIEADLLSQVAANEAKLAELEAQNAQARKDREELEALIGEHTMKQRDLTTRETITTFVYEDVAKSKALNEATLAMIKAAPESSLWPVGLNSLEGGVYAVPSESLLSGRRAALVAAMLGFLLSASAVILREVIVPWWRTVQEAQRQQTSA